MKPTSRILALVAAVLTLSLASAPAQFGRGGMGAGPAGPRLGGTMAKLFGDNSNFSANVEVQTKTTSASEVMSIPGTIAFADGKSRFEMDMTQAKSSAMTAEAVASMKQMGMDKMIMIARPDKKAHYMVYPGLQAYVEMAMQDPNETKAAGDFKIETTELGNETLDGHPCVKNKAVVTDDQGKKHEATIWNATDLKKFPIKIEQTEQGNQVTMLFKDVKFAKPEASQFEPPADTTKYDNMGVMMQQVMMKRMGGAAGAPPPRAQ